MRLLLVGLTFFFNFTGYGQAKVIDTTYCLTSLKQQADSMAHLLLTKEYTTYVNYIYPALVKRAGGRDKMLALIKKSIDEVESQGLKISDVTIGDVSAIISKGKELQCTIIQVLDIKVPGGRLVSKGTLIALSPDNGQRWFFIDAARGDINELRKDYPNLSKDLVIVDEKPIFYRE